MKLLFVASLWWFSVASTVLELRDHIMERSNEMWKTNNPHYENILCDFDLKLADLKLEFYRILQHKTLNTSMQRLMPVSIIYIVRGNHCKISKVADQFEKALEIFFEKGTSAMARDYSRKIYKEVWESFTPKMESFSAKFLPIYSKLKGSKDKNSVILHSHAETFINTIKTVENDFKKISHSVLQDFTRFHREINDVLASCFQKTEDILRSTNTALNGNKVPYKKSQFSAEYHSITKYRLDLEKEPDLFCRWGKHIFEQKARVEYQKDHCLQNSVKCDIHNVKIIIGATAYKRLQAFSSISDSNLPSSIFQRLKNLKGMINGLFNWKRLQDLAEEINKLSFYEHYFEDYEVFLLFSRKFHKYYVSVREQILVQLKKNALMYGNQIKEIIKSITHLNMSSAPFIGLFKEINAVYLREESKIKSHLNILEEHKDESVIFPFIEEARQLYKSKERDIELLSAELLKDAEKFKLMFADGIHELYKEIKSILPEHSSKLFEKYDSTNDDFEEYIINNLPIVREIIQALRDYRSQHVQNEEIFENNYFVESPSESVNSIKDDFLLSNYATEPKYCPLVSIETGNISYIDKSQIKIGTFNAEWLFPFAEYSEDSPRGSYVRKSERKARKHFLQVVDVIAQLEADILILQEVQDCRALSAIIGALEEQGISGYSAYLVENGDIYFGQHVGILTKYKPTEIKYIEGEGMKSVAKNIFARFHFRDQMGNETKLAILGLHLIAGDREKKRDAQAECIADFVQNHLQEDEHLIIMGDMNDYDSRVKGHQPYSNSLEKLSRSRGTLFNAASRVKDKNLKTQLWRGVVDHILVEQTLRFKKAKIHSDLVWKVKDPVSDHAPVTVELKLSSHNEFSPSIMD